MFAQPTQRTTAQRTGFGLDIEGAEQHGEHVVVADQHAQRREFTLAVVGATRATSCMVNPAIRET